MPLQARVGQELRGFLGVNLRRDRINSTRYQVAGRSVYRDQTKILDGLLSATLFTTLMPFRPLNDDTLWAFLADDGIMRKDDGTTIRRWGLAVPAAAPVAAIAYLVGGLPRGHTPQA